jgi:hypothetical protein
MVRLGFTDSRRTTSGADGGLDVISARAAAQVKHHAAKVGRPPLQNLVGAAPRHEFRIFYATAGYTAAAVTYADAEGMHLFRIAAGGEVVPENAAARALSATAAQRLADPGERRRMDKTRKAEEDHDAHVRELSARAAAVRSAIRPLLRSRSRRVQKRAEKGLKEVAKVVDILQSSRDGGRSLAQRRASAKDAERRLKHVVRDFGIKFR